MSQDERQKSGVLNSKQNDQAQNDHELFSNLIEKSKMSPENRHLPSTSATSNKNHQVAQQQQQPQATTTASTNAMSNTQTKLVANLHSAANEGKVELVRLLLRCGADVNAQDEQFGNTALHQAAWDGFSETVQVLCKYRANTSIKNKAQFTPLHMAAQQGHNQSARLLLMASAKTEAKNSYGDTPLHTAARYGHAGVARILLSAKSNPNQVNKNHDTPLHIAAAMGRRKLTKIFMQNGAEPAIKNKQNETPMDIALRKDLVDIQELIANPPPVATNATSNSRRQSCESPHHAHLGQSKQRFGQLYSGTSSQKLQQQQQQQQQVVLRTRQRHKTRQKHLSRHHHAHLSSEDDSNELEHRMQRLHLHQSDAAMHKHLQKSQKVGALRVRGGDAEHLTASSASFLRCAKIAVDELAVDVPDDIEQHQRANVNYEGKQLVNNKGAAFSSLHSLGPNDGHKRSANLDSQCRMKTMKDLSNQADLHLSKGRCEAKDFIEMKGVSECKRVTSSLDLSGQSAAGEACPPDACDNPNDWANMMTKSALYRSTNSPVIELPIDKTTVNLRKNSKMHPTAVRSVGMGNKIELPSPTGSIRSSLSKSHGRVLVRRRKQKTSFLVRKPNLGTCVGKLSLLKLRGIVNKRSGASKNLADNDEEIFEEQLEEDGKEKEDELEEAQVKREEANNVGDKSATTLTKNKAPTVVQRKTPVAAGRRQERIERLEQSCPILAPNGSQLVQTRPLASLTDDTQLYAVPKKTKEKQQDMRVDGNKSGQSGANCGAALDNPAARGERVPSGGPALTSDGGDRSSVDSSASSFARITQHSSSSAIASSSDECIESMDLVCVNKQRKASNQANKTATNGGQSKRPAVVGVHIVGDADLYAPGYSVIRKMPNKTGSDNGSVRSTEACLYRPYGEQEDSAATETGDKITLMGHDEIESKVKLVKASSTQLERQPADGMKQSNNNNCTRETKTTSKLRQLLHLDSRSKSGVKLNGQQHNEKLLSNKTMMTSNESEDGQNGLCLKQNNLVKNHNEPDDESGQSKLPLTAIAGGYYAYSPVVQSASELKSNPIKLNDVTKASQENGKSNGNKSSNKKNWLMSKFSMSSNNSNDNNQPINSTSTISKQSSTPNMKVRSFADKTESANDVTTINSNTLLGPERKAELINIMGTDLRDNGNKGSNPNGRQELVSSPIQHDHNADNISSSSSHLIRPKSAFSATSADLIAAQKSLAAAAAEKVNRDRMVKLCSNGDIHKNNDFISSGNSSDQNCDDLTTSKESVLTVKTSEPFWSTVGHVVNQPIVAHQNGINHQNYLIGQHQLVNHRSGTNSVGMSDSSPSNNGAESDNSIQTTTGSANTDTTTSVGGVGSCTNGITTGRGQRQPTANSKSQDQGSASSPLGILSRILLNNKSFGYRASSGMGATTLSISTPTPTNKENEPLNSIDSKKGSQLMQTVNCSLSSSALSSPSSNNHSPSTITSINNTKVAIPDTTRTSQQKLDQLTSRSRCPIVLTKSNGLPSEEEGKEKRNEKGNENSETRKKNTNDFSPAGCGGDSTAPPLPAKGVLKMPASRTLIQNNHSSNKSAASSNGGVLPSIFLDSMNGLPRVSSYTQIFSSLDQCSAFKQQPFHPFNHPFAKESSKQLCNYHLLNQRSNNWPPSSKLLQYNPYSKQELYNDRYCQSPSCREFMNKNQNYHLEQFQAQVQQQHLHHMSHHDLRPATTDATSSLADLTALPASAALNYEYYLENSPFIQHHLAHDGKNLNLYSASASASASASTATATATSNTNDNSAHHLNYVHDDSIYIPDYMMMNSTKDLNMIRDISNSSAGASELSKDSLMNKRSNFLNQHSNGKLIGRPRPKSSLDTPFISSGVNSLHYPSPIPTTNNGRHFSANLNPSNNNRPVLATETPPLNLQQHQVLPSSSNHHFLSTQNHSSHQTNGNSKSESQNSSPSVGNQPLLSNHNISHFDYKQQLPTYYSYSSPYHHSTQNHNAYLYSENSIYASDQSVAFNRSSDLTVLPTTSSTDTTNNVDSSNDSPKQASSLEVKVSLASGGYNNSFKNGGANNMVTCSTSSSNNIQCPSSPASNQSNRSRTPKALQPQQQQVVERNSWIPNQPYKSLIQIRQLSSAKSNRSQSVQRTLSSRATNNDQSNGRLEEESHTKTMESNSSSSNSSKRPTKVFISNRAQASEFEDGNDSPSTIPVVHENASTVL